MSGICAFFGHRDTVITTQLEEKLIATIRELIAQGIDEFWCCEQGTFDWLCHYVLLKLAKEFCFIRLCLVCPNNPNKYSKLRQDSILTFYDEMIYPAEIANGPARFGILRRNHYVAKNADIIVCYVEHLSGGAYQAVQYAKKFQTKIINLAE